MAGKILKGLRRLKLFPITANTSSAYTVGTAVVLDGAQSLALDPDVSEWKVYADDRIYDSGSDWNGMKLTLQIAELPLEMYPQFEGGTFDSTSKEYTYSADDVAPELGLSFAAATSDGKFRMVKLLALRTTKVKADFKSKGDGGDSASPVTIEAIVTTRALDNAAKIMKDTTTDADLTWLDTLVDE
jgi:phi13 family phage major tail protein